MGAADQNANVRAPSIRLAHTGGRRDPHTQGYAGPKGPPVPSEGKEMRLGEVK